MPDHDPHAAANAQQIRVLREELERRAHGPQEERPPAYVPLMAAALLGLGVLLGWLLWQDSGLILVSGLMGLAILGALAWWTWGPQT